MNNLFDFPWKIFSPSPSNGNNPNSSNGINNCNPKDNGNLNDGNNADSKNSYIGYSQDDEIVPRRLHQEDDDKTAENDGDAGSNGDSEVKERGLETQPMGVRGVYDGENEEKEEPTESNKESAELNRIKLSKNVNSLGIGGTSGKAFPKMQQLQHQAQSSLKYGNAANGKQEIMQETEPARPSPLTQFFANVADEQNLNRDHANTSNHASSVKDWKNSRKQFLLRYFTRRFIGDEDEDDYDRRGSRSGHDCSTQGSKNCDACSFSSDIFDNPFQPVNDQMSLCTSPDHSRTVHAPENNVDSDAEDDKDDDILFTQPEFASQNPLKATNHLLNSPDSCESRGFERVLDDEEPHLQYLNTQENSPPFLAPPLLKTRISLAENDMLGGTKRKAGMISEEDERKSMSPSNSKQILSQSIDGDGKVAGSTIDECNESDGKSNHFNPQKKCGVMWDGKSEMVPHVEDACETCSKLDELDLSTKVLNLELCRVVRIWEIRNTKRMDNMSEHRLQELDVKCPHLYEESHLNTQISSTLEPFEEDGPLNIAYKKVFSLEIVQLDQDIAQEWLTANNQSVSNITAAAFRDGRYHLDKERSRKWRHAIRRIRVFFYDDYADALYASVRKQRKKSDKKFVPFLLSFSRVPAKCILPFSIPPDGYDPHLHQYITQPFGDDEYGIVSPYCICLGGTSSMKLGDEKMRFDCTGLEIRLVRAPENISLPVVSTEESESSETVINLNTVTNTGRSYVVVEEEKVLVRRYNNLFKQSIAVGRETPSLEAGSVSNDACNHLRDRVACQGEDVSGTVVTTTQPKHSPNKDDLSPDKIRRPKSVVPLSNLLPLLRQNNMNALKQSITVYGVVLGFTHPELTRNDWKMTITIIDDTTHLPDQAQPCPTTEKIPSHEPVKLHVPCTTIIIFAKDRSKFPMIRSAGDVVCCQNVTLQQYKTIPQLRAQKSSNVIVLGPGKIRSPGEELHNSTNPDEWFVSCTCQASYFDTLATIDWALANSLWRWGQRRLSQHPTISRTCRISIGLVGAFEQTISDRDLTAIVTDITPVPLHLRRCDLNRGYIRIWDGTGPSYADPVDPIVHGAMANMPQPRGDPPEKVLIEIAKIIKEKSPHDFPDICDGMEAPLALCGRVMNVKIWEEPLWNLIEGENFIHVGSFVRLRNIKCKKEDFGICLSVDSKSSITPLPFDAYEVKCMLRDHQTRIDQGVPTNLVSGILPKRVHGSHQAQNIDRFREDSNETKSDSSKKRLHSKLGECLVKPAPASFHIQFKVLHTIPKCKLSSAEDLKELCFRNKDGSLSFRFALHVTDSSTELDILCFGAVARKILRITEDDVVTSSSKCEEALATLKSIVTSESSTNGTIRSTLGKDNKIYFVLRSLED